MWPTTFDLSLIRRKATAPSETQLLERWYGETNKTKPPFEELTWADAYTEFYVHMWKQLQTDEELLKHSKDGNQRAELAKSVDALRSMFRDETHEAERLTDKLAESWEDMLERGEMPDFTEGMSEEIKRRLGIKE